jgi:Spy/CpxP family protein refolding chaperone
VRSLALLLVLALAFASGLPAQPPDDPLRGLLFPPELVLGQADAIGLDEAQRAGLKQAIGDAQALFLDRQMELLSAVGKLRTLLGGSRVDEGAALEQLDRVLALEREVKRAQIGLLVRIKNLLRPEQQQRLAAERDRR